MSLILNLIVASTLGSPVARAHEISCDQNLASVTRMFPWPEPTPEMREALRAMSRQRDLDETLRRSLAGAVDLPSLDLMVRALFAPATVAQIREAYGSDDALSAHHPLASDAAGLRTALARSIAAVDDLADQRAWMRFLARDRARAVRLEAARTFLNWEDDAARDAFLLEPDLAPGEVLDRILVAQNELERVSPYARWFVVKALAPFREKPLPVLTRAIESLDNPTLAKHWYRDQMRTRTIINRLRNLQKHPLNPEHRRFSALETGQLTHQIGNEAVRRETLREIERLARARDWPELREYAREILLWVNLWDEIYLALRSSASGRPPLATELVVRFARHTHDEETVRLALRAYDAESTHALAPRGDYEEADIRSFEAQLRRY